MVGWSLLFLGFCLWRDRSLIYCVILRERRLFPQYVLVLQCLYCSQLPFLCGIPFGMEVMNVWLMGKALPSLPMVLNLRQFPLVLLKDIWQHLENFYLFVYLFFFSFFCFCLWDKVSCNPGWHWTCYITKDGFELMILLHSPLQCYDYRCVLPCLAMRASYFLD